jgi:DNA invertase Pin-like site-specific DNA recombinase
MSTEHPTKPLRGVFYARKSNDDGTDSADQQLNWAREASARENVTLLECFNDQGVSGQDTARRQDFHAMLRFCQDQHKKGTPVDCIVIWHPNRFSRADSHETSWFIWEFRRVGVHRMFSASHGWRDFRKMEHRLLGLIEQDTSYNPFARDMAQGALRGHITRALEGRRQGGTVPLGYRLTYEEIVYKGKKRRVPDKLVVDEETAWIVREIFRLYLEPGASLGTVAAWLNEQGLPSPLRGGLWYTSTVRYVLGNEHYLGDASYGRRSTGRFFTTFHTEVRPRRETRPRVVSDSGKAIVAKGRHEPLIDASTFARVQAKLVARRPGHDPRGKGRAFRLAGLLFCGHCRRRMVGRYQHGRHRAPSCADRYCYLCSTYNAHRKRCFINLIDEDTLLRALAAKIREKLPPLLDDLRREIHR